MNSVDAAGHDVLGYLAGALTTIAFVPQVVRIVRTRSAHDISWGMFSILSVGVALWLWYGIRLASLPLIVANGVTLALVLAILVLKLRYGATPRASARARHRNQGATMKLAFLGLGVMGYPMAGHLARAGHDVTVYNRTPPKAAKWVGRVRRDAAPPRRPPRRAARDIVLMCVGNDDDVRAVIAGADGALAGHGARARSSSTTRPRRREVAREMYAAARGQGRRVPRRAGVGRPGRRRERQAHDHGRRRRRGVRARREPCSPPTRARSR